MVFHFANQAYETIIVNNTYANQDINEFSSEKPESFCEAIFKNENVFELTFRLYHLECN